MWHWGSDVCVNVKILKYILNKLITFIWWHEEFKDRKTNDQICWKQRIQEISYRKVQNKVMNLKNTLLNKVLAIKV